MMKLPFQHLSLFVIGTLTSVFILIFITENFLSSSGFESRQQVFNCLVNELKSRNVTDDYFPSSSYDDTSNVDCSEIIKNFTVLEDLRMNLFETYNVTLDLCEDITNDKKQKLCDAEGRNNQSKSNNSSSSDVKESCVDVKKHFKVDKTSQNETLEDFYKQSKVNCERLNNCYDCIKASFVEDDKNNYETTMLHAIAVNFTIIDFEVWNYFQISSRVHELVNEANQIVEKAINDCQIKQKCIELSVNLKMR
ncbi:hypothetical protein PVAND_001311 [Polypedilum vanderplanki]|uniref:Uncharacterized protein n=1 Tax=Polypedilum vanderplanki TaxID=319348 RepID=A0A9J6BMJ5_POLVA|nr:hypothetical protein PVAND_001311 [Polypedilum vanderplanki]